MVSNDNNNIHDGTNARELARKLDGSFLQDLLDWGAQYIIGFIPRIGTIVSLSASLRGFFDAQHARDIRSYTDYDEQISWSVAVNPYGTFRVVDYWNGRIVDLEESSTVYTKTEVLNYMYR